ncbi:SDR family oxidoreductase [Mesorhizobium sp. M1399]|uniref:dTDP-4-dehydrorhamnose reductase family protein n=1 Tax=Mesorhizobium sp. M1399 TaxID=2957096 RepID=UPI003338BDD0
MKHRILVLGAGGMLGHALLRTLRNGKESEVFGTVRATDALNMFDPEQRSNIFSEIDGRRPDTIRRIVEKLAPCHIINCIGIVKQLKEAQNHEQSIAINSLLPHVLDAIASETESRLIHISTDCVFSGKKGMYVETDFPDCFDLYGRSKLLGEVTDTSAVTLRTSIIGHELKTSHGLVEWFLSQTKSVHGFRKAIFSGLPTVELSRIIADFVIPNESLRGLYHASANAIDKHALLTLIAKAYGRKIDIVPVDTPVLDRSLDSTRFQAATGYHPPAWVELIEKMQVQR